MREMYHQLVCGVTRFGNSYGRNVHTYDWKERAKRVTVAKSNHQLFIRNKSKK